MPQRNTVIDDARATSPAPRNSRWIPLVIVAAGSLAYANSFHGSFVYDDLVHIPTNPRIQQLWPISELLAGRRPAVDVSLALNYAISDLKVGGYHAFNLAVHLCAALTLYGVIRRSMQTPNLRTATGGAGSWLAGTAALLWVVHPLNTQSVTYIIQRGESMMGLFFLLTLYCVIRANASKWPVRWYAAAVVACALGMASKAVMLTAPLVVLLYDRFFLAPSWRDVLRRRWGLYVALFATWAVPIMSGVAGSVLRTSAGRHTAVGFGFKGITPWEYLGTQPGVILHYLQLSIWPAGLCLDYAWPIAQSFREIVLPAIAIAALVTAALWVGRRHRWVAFAAVWFFLILAPTSSIVPIRDPLVEHRMYLPLAAVILVIVAGVRSLVVWSVIRCQVSVIASLLRRPCIEPALATAAVIALGAATFARNLDYRSELAMWSDVVEKRPNNARGYLNLGSVAPTPEDALHAYHEAIRIKPDYADAHYNLGAVLARLGRTDAAMAAYREALRHDPQHDSARFNLANALAGRGAVEQSIEEYRRLLEFYPRHARALVNLGISLAGRGEMQEAADCFRRAVEADPAFADAHYNLGIALLQLGHPDEAVATFRTVLEIEPGHGLARESLQAALRQRGQ